jgi:hypothetical protein
MKRLRIANVSSTNVASQLSAIHQEEAHSEAIDWLERDVCLFLIASDMASDHEVRNDGTSSNMQEMRQPYLLNGIVF